MYPLVVSPHSYQLPFSLSLPLFSCDSFTPKGRETSRGVTGREKIGPSSCIHAQASDSGKHCDNGKVTCVSILSGEKKSGDCGSRGGTLIAQSKGVNGVYHHRLGIPGPLTEIQSGEGFPSSPVAVLFLCVVRLTLISLFIHKISGKWTFLFTPDLRVFIGSFQSFTLPSVRLPNVAYVIQLSMAK